MHILKKKENKQTRNSWKKRKLTLVGKINNIKTKGLSKLICHSSLLTVPKSLVTEYQPAQNQVENDSWRKAPRRLKMIDSEIMERSLKVA